MPANKNTDRGEGARQRAAIERSLETARKRILSRRLLLGLRSTVVVPAIGAAGWIALSRFTLLEPPRWPVLVPLLLWLLALLAWSRSARPARTQCARYVDHALNLDERLTTYIELETRRKMGEASYAFLPALRKDAADLVNRNLQFLGSAYRTRLGVRHYAGIALTLAFLVAAMLVPSQFDAVKAERRQVERTLAAQVASIEQLRADLVSRPGVPDTIKQSLDAQLRELETQLTTAGSDRADALASIASLEDKVRALQPPGSPSDFDAFLASARQIQAGATQTTDWDPFSSEEKDELGKAAEALDHTKTYVNQFTNVQARGMASALERAADLASAKDAALAQHLTDAASALRKRDQAGAEAQLTTARDRFREIEQQQQSAQAVENTLAKLADGRQAIARAGTQATRKSQVGFRRSTDNTPLDSQSAQAAPAQTPQDVNASDATPAGTGVAQQSQGPAPGTGQNIGQNQPASGGAASQAGGAGGKAANGSGSGGQSTQDGAGTKNAAAGSHQSGGAGAGQGGGSGGAGTQQGAISGPVRVGGATAGGGDAAGTGTGSSGGSGAQAGNAGEQPSEQLYLPGSGPAARTGVGGQASPESSNGVSGRVGEGETGSGSAADPGLGQLNQVRTPYKEVLGKYSQQATDALDRAYVPPDAKEYVRDYFTQLGK